MDILGFNAFLQNRTFSFLQIAKIPCTGFLSIHIFQTYFLNTALHKMETNKKGSKLGIWAEFDPLPLVTLIKYIDFRVFLVSGVSWGNLNRIHIWGTKWEFHRGTHVNL